MKKSEIYTRAMKAVLKDSTLAVSEQLDIIETLLADRNVARWSEKQEAEKEEAEQA